jgi:hypothetical protein
MNLHSIDESNSTICAAAACASTDATRPVESNDPARSSV